jgi:cell wall-associated NlpC family hydrolase
MADAFKIVRASSSRGTSCTTTSTSDGGLTSAEKGRKVLREGRKYLGIRYRYGTCTSTLMSCTCLTKRAYSAVGINLSLMEIEQWKKGRRVSTPRKGDLLFYDEDGAGGKAITHVGVYAGKNRYGTRMILHASSYWGKVVIKPMRWRGDGYIGARRLV